MTQEQQNILKEFIAAISSYQGNVVTNFNPFNSLVLEEKINILADAVTALLLTTISGEKKGEV